MTWLEESTDTDLAISFQETIGAREIWEIIWNIQGKNPDELSQDEDSDEDFLPDPDLSQLQFIHNKLQLIDYSEKQKVIDNILKNDEEFLNKLKSVFEKVRFFVENFKI